MKFKIFSSVVALALIFSACSELFDEANKGLLGDNSFPSLTWSAADKDAAVNIEAVKNDTRKNASGPKITSNAHSADFPGIFFIWDSKQKDNGYLKVAAAVFDKYEGFVLTAKESNTYWDFPIAVMEGQQKTSDGCYVFYIPKVYNNKNINMVFLSEFKEKRIIPCDYETVTVLFHSGNGAKWGYGPDAIIEVPYNYCDDDCFDEWLKAFTPEGFWKDKPGYDEYFSCGFERWRMASYESDDAEIECLPAIRIETFEGKTRKVVLLFAVRGECDPCTLEPVDVWFYPMNDGKWGYDAIIKKVYNPCDGVCFEDWAKQFTPEEFWGDKPGFDEFMCTFEEFVMGTHKGTLPYYNILPWACDPVINGENSRPGASIFAVHGENKCAIAPAVVTVDYTVNFLETYNEITHGPVYATSGGGAVSFVNVGGATMIPIPNSEGMMPVYELGNGITGGYYSKPGSKANNAFTGKTYIAIDVASLPADGANIDFGTEPQSNGSIPQQTWNPNLKGSYNVKIVDGELIVTINDYRSGQWDAILFSMDANRVNNIHSKASTATRTEKNLGPVSGTVYLYFTAGTITFNEIVDCQTVSTEAKTRTPKDVDYEVVVSCGVAAVNGKVLTYDTEGTYTVTVDLLVNGVVVATEDVTVEVTKNDRSLVAANVSVDFGDYTVGAGANEIICDICQ